MIVSKYLEKFNQLKNTGKFNFRGPFLFVEALPKMELRTEAGLFLGSSTKSHKGTADDFRTGMGIVLYCGSGYTDGGKMDISEGMVVNLPTQLTYLSEFPGLSEYTQMSIAIIKEDDVLFYYKSIEDFQAVYKELTGAYATC